jgi:hypothetical protein
MSQNYGQTIAIRLKKAPNKALTEQSRIDWLMRGEKHHDDFIEVFALYKSLINVSFHHIE